MRGWLRARIHSRGCLLPWSELVVEATGAELSPEPFLSHLRRRYLGEN
jgi:carboxypeptidase Taq